MTPDRYGRMTAKERKSAMLMRLAYWGLDGLSSAGEIESISGLVMAIRLARRAGATNVEMAKIMGCDPETLIGIGEVENGIV